MAKRYDGRPIFKQKVRFLNWIPREKFEIWSQKYVFEYSSPIGRPIWTKSDRFTIGAFETDWLFLGPFAADRTADSPRILKKLSKNPFKQSLVREKIIARVTLTKM